MPLEMSRLTREFVDFPFTTPDDMLEAQGAEAAFMDPGVRPGPTDWKPAEIVKDVLVTDKWYVRILVGPGLPQSVDLTPTGETPKDYQAWTAVNDNPERVVRRPGIVTIE
jgi:hypothetical protein